MRERESSKASNDVDLRVPQKRVALGRLIYGTQDFNKWLQVMNRSRERSGSQGFRSLKR